MRILFGDRDDRGADDIRHDNVYAAGGGAQMSVKRCADGGSHLIGKPIQVFTEAYHHMHLHVVDGRNREVLSAIPEVSGGGFGGCSQGGPYGDSHNASCRAAVGEAEGATEGTAEKSAAHGYLRRENAGDTSGRDRHKAVDDHAGDLQGSSGSDRFSAEGAGVLG